MTTTHDRTVAHARVDALAFPDAYRLDAEAAVEMLTHMDNLELLIVITTLANLVHETEHGACRHLPAAAVRARYRRLLAADLDGSDA